MELSFVSVSKPLKCRCYGQMQWLNPSRREAEPGLQSFRTTRTTKQRPNSNEDPREGFYYRSEGKMLWKGSHWICPWVRKKREKQEKGEASRPGEEPQTETVERALLEWLGIQASYTGRREAQPVGWRGKTGGRAGQCREEEAQVLRLTWVSLRSGKTNQPIKK